MKLIILACLATLMLGCSSPQKSESFKTNEAFVMLAKWYVDGWGLRVVCDVVRGNLIYLWSDGGIFVLPSGGCLHR